MSLQLVEGETVQVQFAQTDIIRKREIGNGRFWKVIDFHELLYTAVSAETFTIVNNLAGKVGTNAWHTAQLAGVSTIKKDAFSGL